MTRKTNAELRAQIKALRMQLLDARVCIRQQTVHLRKLANAVLRLPKSERAA